MAAGDFRPISGRLSVAMFTTGTAINEGELVEIESNLAIKADAAIDANSFLGVCASTIDGAGQVAVYYDGIFEGTAGSAMDFGLGDLVYAGASGEVLDTGTSGDFPIGRVVGTNPASAGTVQFSLISCLTSHPGEAKA